jgi:RNA polymerase sigma-70 factor (ECF subfamily)
MERVRLSSTPPAGRPVMVVFGHVGAVPATTADRRMPTDDEVNAWMRAVAEAADRPAFAALFRHFAPRIKGFLMRSGADEALAEELVQETMVVLWRRAASFDPARAQVSTWLYTIARNLRIDHHRRHAGGAAEAPDDWDAEQQPADAHLTPDELLHAAERERGVQQALAVLPPEQAQVLRLSFFDEHPHSRIARDLGIPLGTVKSRIRLAVAQLRRILEHTDA